MTAQMSNADAERYARHVEEEVAQLLRARVGDYGVTVGGRPFWPEDPRIGDINLDDIAHALAHQCRFAGHTHSHYSVAQHSVLVSFACSPKNALVGLLHDAAEAYLQDIIKPLKKAITGYRKLEDLWATAIGLTFGLGDRLVELPEDVHRADRMVLIAERRDLMPPCAAWKFSPDEPSWPDRIEPWSAGRARAEFLERYRVLAGPT